MPQEWSDVVSECVPGSSSNPEPATIKCLEAVFANLVSALILLAPVALFIMLIIGGFTYLTSAGDAKKAEKARSTMTWAIVGLVLMISSYIFLRIIEWFTGAPVLDFTIPTF